MPSVPERNVEKLHRVDAEWVDIDRTILVLPAAMLPAHRLLPHRRLALLTCRAGRLERHSRIAGHAG